MEYTRLQPPLSMIAECVCLNCRAELVFSSCKPVYDGCCYRGCGGVKRNVVSSVHDFMAVLCRFEAIGLDVQCKFAGTHGRSIGTRQNELPNLWDRPGCCTVHSGRMAPCESTKETGNSVCTLHLLAMLSFIPQYRSSWEFPADVLLLSGFGAAAGDHVDLGAGPAKRAPAWGHGSGDCQCSLQLVGPNQAYEALPAHCIVNRGYGVSGALVLVCAVPMVLGWATRRCAGVVDCRVGFAAALCPELWASLTPFGEQSFGCKRCESRRSRHAHGKLSLK